MAHELLGSLFQPEEGKAQWATPDVQQRLVDQVNYSFLQAELSAAYTKKKLDGVPLPPPRPAGASPPRGL